MRRTTSLVALVIGASALTGCGSSKQTTSGATASTATGPPPGAVTISHPPPPAKPRTYRVKLIGSNEVPAGAPAGSALAAISIKAKGEVCWEFSALKGVVAPSAAHIHHGASGISGPIVIPLGGAYKPSGCATGAAPQLLALIEANPQRFYVNIHNAKYPGGAVRAQL